MTTRTEIGSLPVVDQHPLVLEHGRKRVQLATALTEALAEHGRLVDFRAPLKQQIVAQLLGDGGGQPGDAAARLTKLETDILSVGNQVASIKEALVICDGRLVAARTQAETERREQARSIAREIAGQMQPILDKLLALNEQLVVVSAARGFDGRYTPLDPGLMLEFRRQLGD
ncbi:MAG: hypothetical protein ABJA98_22105 [Acidobacteriota bacterium]